jgi:hypothetical protein
MRNAFLAGGDRTLNGAPGHTSPHKRPVSWNAILECAVSARFRKLAHSRDATVGGVHVDAPEEPGENSEVIRALQEETRKALATGKCG